MISLVCLSVILSAPFCPYNSKTIRPIELKFVGLILYGVQTNFSKFGVIELKVNVRREFYFYFQLDIYSKRCFSLSHT